MAVFVDRISRPRTHYAVKVLLLYTNAHEQVDRSTWTGEEWTEAVVAGEEEEIDRLRERVREREMSDSRVWSHITK